MAYTGNFSLEGKVALITGASYGIGFAIAKGLAAAGATIVFNDLKQEFVDKGLASVIVLRLDLGIGIHAPYSTDRTGYYNMPKKFKDSLGLHFAIGYPF